MHEYFYHNIYSYICSLLETNNYNSSHNDDSSIPVVHSSVYRLPLFRAVSPKPLGIVIIALDTKIFTKIIFTIVLLKSV